MTSLAIFACASVGAVTQQWFHYRDLEVRLSPKRWATLTKGKKYYIYAGIDVLIFSTLATFYAMSGKRAGAFEYWDIAVLGAAASALFKNAVSGLTKRKAKAGDKLDAGNELSAYFGIE